MNTSHYPSLELCKKLTEIGFPMTEKFHMNGGIWDSLSDRWMSEYASWCPSVMELLDVMPKRISDGFYDLEINYEMGVVQYIFRGFSGEGTEHIKAFEINTLPNALAEMILWLKENNYITFTK